MSKRPVPLRSAVAAALMAAILCVLCPLSVPVGPIPITLATLAIYFSAYVLPWQWAAASVGVYLLLGAVGLPVFSGYAGGLGRLLGPTGGYLIGYLPLAVCCALAVGGSRRRWVHLAGMALGTALLYILGTAWFCLQSGAGLADAVAKCVWIFLPGDFLKMAAALLLGPVLRRRLAAAGLLSGAREG